MSSPTQSLPANPTDATFESALPKSSVSILETFEHSAERTVEVSTPAYLLDKSSPVAPPLALRLSPTPVVAADSVPNPEQPPSASEPPSTTHRVQSLSSEKPASRLLARRSIARQSRQPTFELPQGPMSADADDNQRPAVDYEECVDATVDKPPSIAAEEQREAPSSTRPLFLQRRMAAVAPKSVASPAPRVAPPMSKAHLLAGAAGSEVGNAKGTWDNLNIPSYVVAAAEGLSGGEQKAETGELPEHPSIKVAPKSSVVGRAAKWGQRSRVPTSAPSPSKVPLPPQGLLGSAAGKLRNPLPVESVPEDSITTPSPRKLPHPPPSFLPQQPAPQATLAPKVDSQRRYRF